MTDLQRAIRSADRMHRFQQEPMFVVEAHGQIMVVDSAYMAKYGPMVKLLYSAT